jgi:hypothetical protein
VQDVGSNRALSLKLIHALLAECLFQASDSPNETDKADWVKAGAYFATCYVTSLRGPEGRLFDLGGLIHFVDMDTDSTNIVL